MTKDDIRLYVTIDKRLYRDAILYQLLLEENIDLVGESATGVDTLEQLPTVRPTVLIIEEALQDNDGLTIAEVALSNHPALSVLLLVERPVSPARLAIYLESGIKTSPDLEAFHALSAREREVARLMADRVAFKTIADRLGVSYKTVHSYKDRIFIKMGFERQPDLMLFMKRFRNNLDS